MLSQDIIIFNQKKNELKPSDSRIFSVLLITHVHTVIGYTCISLAYVSQWEGSGLIY